MEEGRRGEKAYSEGLNVVSRLPLEVKTGGGFQNSDCPYKITLSLASKNITNILSLKDKERRQTGL